MKARVISWIGKPYTNPYNPDEFLYLLELRVGRKVTFTVDAWLRFERGRDILRIFTCDRSIAELLTRVNELASGYRLFKKIAQCIDENLSYFIYAEIP